MVFKVFRRIGIGLGSLIGLLALAFIVLYTIGSIKWNKLHGEYEVPAEAIAIPTDQASITRGQMTDDELRAMWLYLQSLPALGQGK
jgi:hypothetical protein